MFFWVFRVFSVFGFSPVGILAFWAPGCSVEDIADWAVPNDADYIALSFVQ